MLATIKHHPKIARFGGMILGLALAAGCTPSGPQALLQGEQLIREGNYEKAILKLKIATDELPRQAQAWNHLGLAYHGARQPEPAVRAYQQALTLDPNLAPAYFNLGCLLLEQNNPNAALPLLNRFLQFQPRAAEGWLKLGLAQFKTHQWAAAEQSYKLSIQLQQKNPVAWNELGLLHLQRNQPREALDCFATALQQQPDYAPALLNQAILYQQQYKNRPLALQKYRDYLSLKPFPPNSPAIQEIVRQLEAELRPPASRPPLTNLLRQVAAVTNGLGLPTNGARLSPSLTLKAVPATNAATQPGPPKIVSGAPRPISATPLTETVPVKPKSPPPAPSASSPGNPPNRIVAAPAAPAAFKNNISPPVSTVPRVASAQLSSKTQVKPAAPPPPPALAPALAPVVPATTTPSIKVAGAASDSIPPSATVSAPKKPKLLGRLNPVRWVRSKSAARITPLPRLPGSEAANPTSVAPPKPEPPKVSVEPPAPPPPARYPYVHPPKPPAGDRRGAEVVFAQGIEEQREEHWNEAIAAYRKAAETDPSYFDARYNLALAAYHAGLLPQALLEFETALALNPASFNARYNFALTLQRANYPRAAANELEPLLTVAPEDTRLHLLLGNLYAQQLFQPELARLHYLKLLELDPGNPQAAAIRYWLAAHP